MLEELQKRITNILSRFKYYLIILFPVAVLLVPYFINSILPTLNSKWETSYNLFIFLIFLLFISQIIARMLFKINFKIIDNVSKESTYVEKIFNNFFALLFIILAIISYLSAAINYSGDIINIIMPTCGWLFIIDVYLSQVVNIGENYLAYNFKVIKLDKIKHYNLEKTSFGNKEVKLFLDHDKTFTINIIPVKEDRLISDLKKKGIKQKD